MNKFLKSLIICISTLVPVVPVISQSFSNKVVIHGFISQGYMKSTHNNYLIPTKDGSYEFNEAAVNFTAYVTDNLRMGLQLFSRDFGREGNNDVLLDWAYADYLWKDALGIRLGKIKIPVGFYNQIRDIDLLRTSILLPQGVYEEAMRDFLLAHQGASLYGNIPLLSAGSIDYEIVGGSLSIPDPRTGWWRFVFLDLLGNVTQFYPDGTVGSVRDPSVTGKYALGGSFKWNTPLQGLRLGGSYNISKLFLAAYADMVWPIPLDLSFLDPRLQGIALRSTDVIEMEIDIDIKNYYTLSAEYSWDNLRITGEYLSTDFKTDVSLMLPETPIFSDKITFKPEGYYVQIQYQFCNWLELGTYYSEFYPNRKDKEGKTFKETGDHDYLAWQKDACLTIRLDMAKNWTSKFEYHLIDGGGQVRKFDNPEGIKRHWGLFAVKTSFHF